MRRQRPLSWRELDLRELGPRLSRLWVWVPERSLLARAWTWVKTLVGVHV